MIIGGTATGEGGADGTDILIGITGVLLHLTTILTIAGVLQIITIGEAIMATTLIPITITTIITSVLCQYPIITELIMVQFPLLIKADPEEVIMAQGLPVIQVRPQEELLLNLEMYNR